jgi:hypothetical protein
MNQIQGEYLLVVYNIYLCRRKNRKRKCKSGGNPKEPSLFFYDNYFLIDILEGNANCLKP